jgi:predicted DNA-binding transcriptional regulator AlpA
MRDAGLSIPALAAATKGIDPEGKGISRSLIGFAVSGGKSGRDEISDHAAHLIARVLHKPESSLFETDAVSVAAESTSTPREQIMRPNSPSSELEPLVDTATLAGLIGKSRTWIYDMRKQHPRGSTNPFPVVPVGKTPRYRYSAVLAWLERDSELAAA